MEARVCVGGAGAGAEPTPPTLTHSAPQPGRSVRCLLFCSAPTAPGSPHLPRLSYHHRRPDPAGTPPPGFPAQTRRSAPPGPPAGCRGYNGAAERRDLTFHGGRGGRPPPGPRRASSPRPPGLSGRAGHRAADGDFPAGGGETSSPLLARPLRPSPNVSGLPGKNGAPGQLGGGCGRRPPGLLPIAPGQ